ncbi:CG30203, partial [Drosophila busckii]
LTIYVLYAVSRIEAVQAACSRIPQGASGERSAVDDNFKVLIDGNPVTYIPEQQYNVSLSCPSTMKFLSFTLSVEREEPMAAAATQDLSAGHFELFNNIETRFTVGCENMIESTNTNAKTRIDVSWVAPKQPDSGCVLIKAAIVQHRNVWFIDDGFLTKRICAEEIDELNSQTPTLQNCCACDEAKYEIVLERKWARNTHAKDFPSEAWRTRLGEVIGASHKYSFRYWAYGALGSQGMRELAEHGATRTLEQEIKNNTQNGEVRTIIKAPGIGYRANVVGTTLANARVDPLHHQISLAAKIDPSPDWIIGVAGLELCLSNCTWLESKVLNLYPWDVGTDSGPSYMSADQPQVPPDVIRRITSSYPSDYRSPFFDGSGVPMKPMATLHITRKKLYIRECEEVPQEGPLECATHPWNDWSNCSTRCGSGYAQRERSYKNPALAASYSCDRRLEELRQCQGMQCGLEEEQQLSETAGEADNEPNSQAECELSDWSEWSPCSRSCGRGFILRTRDYYNQRARARCQAAVKLPLKETRSCIGSDCGGTIPDNGELDAVPEQDSNLFGETNEESSSNSWNSFRAKPTEESNSWNSFRAKPTEESNSWNSFRGKPIENERTTNSWSSNKDAPEYQRGYGSNRRTNPYEQLGLDNADNRQQQPLGSNYNDYRQDQRYNEEQATMKYNMAYATTPRTMTPYGRNDYNQPRPSNGYNVVQDYCFEKPFASTEPCIVNPVIVSNYWFYDHDDHECKIFTTDNCDTNSNRFRTLMACEGTCLKPQMNLE